MSILIRGGHVIDPSGGIDDAMDVGIEGNTVTQIESRIPAGKYDRVIEASGKIVVPGLIDMHTHVAEYLTPGLGINADSYCLARGTATAVDAGSTGELSFPSFRKFIIDRSETRIFAFINYESLGMIEFPPAKTGQRWPELTFSDNESMHELFVNEDATAKMIRKNSDVIRGVKWAHRGPESFRKAAMFAHGANITLMAENHHMPGSLSHLRKGDIVTHIFHNDFNRVAGRIDGMLDADGEIPSEYHSAKKRGILFDLGHGTASFSWSVARKALEEGIFPDIISTDLWLSNTASPVVDLPTTMSKMLHLGMSLPEVVRSVTQTPGSILDRSGKTGSLKPGSTADVTVLSELKGSIELTDSTGTTVRAERALVPEAVVRRGVQVV